MRVGILLSCILLQISCSRVTDKLYSKDYNFNQQDNNSLYNELLVDSSELVDFMSLKGLVDSLEFEVQSQLDFLDSIDSNYSPRTIIKGDRTIISNFYKSGLKEKEILSLLRRIDSKFILLNNNYDQKNFNFLPTDSLLMYDKMSIELLSGLFEITISSVRDAEKETLLKKIKN